MPFYLCSKKEKIPFPGKTGFSVYPARARENPGCSWIYLHDPYSLMWFLNDISAPELTKIATDKIEKLANASKNVIRNMVGENRDFPPGITFDLAIADIFKRAPSNNRWKGLAPSVTNQRFEIWLGPRRGEPFWTEPFTLRHRSQFLQDNFNRSGVLNGSTSSDGLFTWIKKYGTVAFSTDGSEAIYPDIPDGSWNQHYSSVPADTADAWDQLKISTFTIPAGQPSTALTIAYLIVRNATVADNTGYGYCYYWAANGGSPGWGDQIKNYNTDEILDENWDIGSGVGKTIKIIADGSSITGYRDASLVLGPVTDTDHEGATGERDFAFIFYNNNTNDDIDIGVDNFTAGDVGEPAESVSGLARANATISRLAKLKRGTGGAW